MGEVAYDLQNEPEYKVEIVVHVDQALDEGQRSDLVSFPGEFRGYLRGRILPAALSPDAGSIRQKPDGFARGAGENYLAKYPG